MSDTTTITAEERAKLRELAVKSYLLPLDEDEVPGVGFDGLTDERIAYIAAACNSVPRLLNALEQAEARAEKVAQYAGKCAAKALDKAAQLETMRATLNTAESRAEKAEAENARLRAQYDDAAEEVETRIAWLEIENARLTKMVDWLAEKHIRCAANGEQWYGPTISKEQHVPMYPSKNEAIDALKEAARRAVAAGEETCPKQL